jgi:hypothetical protein
MQVPPANSNTKWQQQAPQISNLTQAQIQQQIVQQMQQ